MKQSKLQGGEEMQREGPLHVGATLWLVKLASEPQTN